MRSFAFEKVHWAPEMLSCGAGGGGTNQGAGIEEAIEELTVNGTVASVKSIILISDGEPIDGSVYSWWKEFGGPNLGGRSAAEYGNYQANIADDHEYSIFSVSFNDRPAGYLKERQTRYLRGLTRGFGEFFETPNSSELPSILRAIAENIPIVIVQ